MIHAWWFKLYTLPSIKKVIFATSALAWADFLLTHYFLRWSWVPNLFFLIFWSLPIAASMVFVMNLEFHKSNINLPELRSALLKDSFIRLVVSLICFLLLFASSRSLGVLSRDSALFMPISLLVFLATYLSFMTCGLGIVIANRKYRIFDIDKSKLTTKFKSTLMYTALVLVVLIFVGIYGELVFVLTATSVVLGLVLYFFRKAFNLENAPPRNRTFLKYSLIGSPLSFVFLLTFIMLSKGVINDHRYSTASRLMLFSTLDSFAPPLDEAVSLAFIEADSRGEFFKLIYFNSSKEFREIPLQDLGIKVNSLIAFEYLKATKTVPKETLLFIMTVLDQEKVTEENSYIHTLAGFAVVNKWPKDLELPEKLLKVKVARDNYYGIPSKEKLGLKRSTASEE
jgi:hypothetical protein